MDPRARSVATVICYAIIALCLAQTVGAEVMSASISAPATLQVLGKFCFDSSEALAARNAQTTHSITNSTDVAAAHIQYQVLGASNSPEWVSELQRAQLADISLICAQDLALLTNEADVKLAEDSPSAVNCSQWRSRVEFVKSLDMSGVINDVSTGVSCGASSLCSA